MPEFQKRLLDLKKKYFLTTSDLSVLLNCHRSTVHAWEIGVAPSPAKLPLLGKRLALIEKAAGKSPSYFPVPLGITQYQRKYYLLSAINVISSRLLKQSTTSQR